MQDITVTHAVTAIAWIANIGSNTYFQWTHGGDNVGLHRGFSLGSAAPTPFDANILGLNLFQLLLVFTQAWYALQYLESTSAVLNYHFILYNVLQFIWPIALARGYSQFAFALVLLNLIQLLAAYILYRSYRITPLRQFLGVHVSAIALPLIYVHYLTFWTGAVAWHTEHHIPKLVGNVLIWEFLVVPAVLMLFFGDWAAGYAASYISFIIFLGVRHVKHTGHQSTFSLIISAVLLAHAIYFSKFKSPVNHETAPLLV